MSASAIEFSIGANSTAFKSGLHAAKEQVNEFKNEVRHSLTEAFTAVAVIESLREIATEMDRVQKLGIRFDVPAEEIQRVGHVASLAGTDIEGVAGAMGKATKAAVAARDGNKQAADAFAELHINAADFINLPLSEKVIALSEGLQGVKGDGEKLALTLQVLGRNGAEMLPLLAEGPEKLREEFEGVNVASQQTVDQIAAFNDELEDLKQKSQVALGSTVFPLISRVIIGLQMMYADVKALVEAIATVGVAIATWNFAPLREQLDGIRDDFVATIDKLQSKLDGTGGEHGGGVPGEAGGNNDVAARADADALAKEQQALAKIKSDAADAALSDAEKLNKLEAEQLDLKKQAYEAGKTDLEYATLQRQEAEKQIEIDKQRKKIADDQQAREASNADTIQKAGSARFAHFQKTHEEGERDRAKAQTERERAGESLKKAALEAAQKMGESLKQSIKTFSVDDTRKIGGSLAGVNYAAITTDVAKQQLTVLRTIQKAIDEINRKDWTVEVPNAK